jgi:hypothetical protein
VAVKLLHTLDMKRFVGADLKIDFTANRPNPEDLRIEFLTAAALIPSLSKNATTDIGRAPGGRRREIPLKWNLGFPIVEPCVFFREKRRKPRIDFLLLD